MDVMARIAAAVELGHGGAVEEARRQLAALWEEPAVQADPFHRCALAHHAADLEPEVADELRWDVRALAAADAVTPERDTPIDVAAFYPSLHLNLGDAFRRAEDLPAAPRASRAGPGLRRCPSRRRVRTADPGRDRPARRAVGRMIVGRGPGGPALGFQRRRGRAGPARRRRPPD
ncbi:hypothetical protein [Actinomycetospora corticicola]|uniref:Uncharacterized protein n=1 Tax=Actinomycetospora corticicola TaxID=663602 RepID=A0A7Y9DZ90_9PSEU|nr:hypothetical protein [Actinomycetospora corticicola]NYD38217.1 hypothetical protein [Actinomycetospora corticicola]